MRLMLKYIMVMVLSLSLSACVTPGGPSGWNVGSSTGHVTNDPDSIPDIAWQTGGQRGTLAAQSQKTPEAPQKKVTAALLLPLSGKHAALGQSMLKAAQMALFDVGSANFELVPRDTGGTPEGAASAAQSAIAAGDDMILGPVFADDVRAVKPVAAAARVPVLAFTTDWNTAGGGTYVLGFLPFAQVARVAEYARGKGVETFAAYAPQTEYADVVLGAMRQSGASPARLGRYAPAQADLMEAVKTFGAQNMTATPDGKQKPAFDALMLPVGGEGLSTLVSMLDLAGISNDNTRFIGTGLWDDPALAQNPALHGGWFAAPDPALRRDFERRYQENYGAAPLRLASLAYDATAMAAVLARNGGDAPYATANLTNPRGFAGIDGIFRLRPDGLSDRGLAILEITGAGNKVVDRAPTAFIAPGG